MEARRRVSNGPCSWTQEPGAMHLSEMSIKTFQVSQSWKHCHLTMCAFKSNTSPSTTNVPSPR